MGEYEEWISVYEQGQSLSQNKTFRSVGSAVINHLWFSVSSCDKSQYLLQLIFPSPQFFSQIGNPNCGVILAKRKAHFLVLCITHNRKFK